MKKNLKVAAITGLLVIIPLLSLAQAEIVPPLPASQGNAFAYLLNLVDKLATYMLSALIVVAAVMIIYAGFIYLTAGSNPENVDKGKNILIYAAVAIGIGLLAKIVTLLARQFVSSPNV